MTRLNQSCIAPAILPWPNWQGQVAVCIATGPSLTTQQVEVAKHSPAKIIGINDIGLHHEVDIWYGADHKFWKHYRPDSNALRVGAQKHSLDDGLVDRLLTITKDREIAERYQPGIVYKGVASHSGFQALQLAISLGAKRVILLGYDCKPIGRKTNYFGQKCFGLQATSDYESWPECYRELRLPEGVGVINATPGSAITCYPFLEISEALDLK